jgi:hypothetical protein
MPAWFVQPGTADSAVPAGVALLPDSAASSVRGLVFALWIPLD